ncbi:transglycosylase SLT domain-containing protein [Candidatus Thiothrix sp. Deng01]|uniref:Transglycosylase SLT domain-containing protein n=1 Tax=Candidatus Thiothrix phosphatis TaxID=3112415 RepID=A0ABU6D241_9GAMM|nr:transglycosylase SLT domain-containing protein [Candidatus Thiothrix sp. Deng01]MEB4593128.1 transglycosylase SLT domain-containing protein [Candidatus Thiothrix sp. Deng01]
MKQVIPYLTGAVLAFMLLALMAADSDNAEAAGKKKHAGSGQGCQTLSPANLQARAGPYHAAIHSAANQYGVNPSLVKAVITVESCFRAQARGSLGEKGLMQLMPGTARRFDIRNGYNATQSIHGGSRYLSYLLRRYDGNMQHAVAAYNAGEGRIKLGGYIPNKAYVSKVMSAYGKFAVAGSPSNPAVQPQVTLAAYLAPAADDGSAAGKQATTTASAGKTVQAKTSPDQAGVVVHKAAWKAAVEKTPRKPITAAQKNSPGTALPWPDLQAHYQVKPGDTVYAVMRQTGAPVKTLIRANRLKAPYGIQAGQTLRIK